MLNMIGGSLGNHMRNMELQMKWQERKNKETYSGTSGSQWAAEQQENQESDLKETLQPTDKNKLQMIHQKLYNGKKLSAAEMEELRKNDPQAYQKAKNIEQERAAYEQELRRCRTKEEVQRVKMMHLGVSLSTVNEIKNDPNIPEEKKLEYIAQENAKTKALEKVMERFVSSGELKELPTEAEQAKAMKELEAEKTEQIPGEKEEAMGKIPETKTETTDATEGNTISAKRKQIFEESLVKQDSPELKKVKRARAKAAYAHLYPAEKSTEGMTISIDEKA